MSVIRIGPECSMDSTRGLVSFNTDPSYTQHLPVAKDYKFPTCHLPINFKIIADRVHNFPIRADDVWLLSFPKTGSTWLQNIIWLLKHNLDYDTDRSVRLQERCHFLEMGMDGPKNENDQKIFTLMDSTSDIVANQKSPRLFKSHLPVNLLPKQMWSVRPKIVYVTRNPKDVAISYFHYIRNMGWYSGPLGELLELFLNEKVVFAPFHSHVLNFWQLRDWENVLFITYEEMMADRFGAIKKISEFLQCEYSEEQLQELTAHVSIDNMRKNDAVNQELEMNCVENAVDSIKPESGFKFLRKGKVGSYRDEMSAEMIKRFDDWTAEKLKDSDFKFAV